MNSEIFQAAWLLLRASDYVRRTWRRGYADLPSRAESPGRDVAGHFQKLQRVDAVKLGKRMQDVRRGLLDFVIFDLAQIGVGHFLIGRLLDFAQSESTVIAYGCEVLPKVGFVPFRWCSSSA